jgi:glycosyltransferase involved in cell wall biosynthesis
VRIAFVVQRYGEQVAGGAEALCRDTARALAAAGDEVVVHTTTARDYLHWTPHYPEGVHDDGGVRVHRHAVRPADPRAAEALVRGLALDPGDADAERRWALAQGPVAPGMLRALADAGRRHEVVAFWTYLYATSQLGLPLCRDRAVLVPLAHDEPMLRFALTRGLVRAAAGLAFMTPEEALLVDDLHGVGGRPAAVVGAGLGPVGGGRGIRRPDAAAAGAEPGPRAAAGRTDAEAVAQARRRLGLPGRYVLYLGRVDPSKGVDALVRAHAAYRAGGGRLGLVLAGREAGMPVPPEWVVRTGFVSEADREALLAGCEVVVVPSRLESLSLVALEAWRARRPTLATAASEVVAGQTRRSGGGLTYEDAPGYAAALRRLEADAGLRAALGDAGADFAAAATWDACVRRWRGLLAQVRRPLARGD